MCNTMLEILVVSFLLALCQCKNTTDPSDMNIACERPCVYSYAELRHCLLELPGNQERILNVFFPPSEASPDVVDVVYIISGTQEFSSFDNGSLECSDGQEQEGDYLYTWTNNQLFLSLDPNFFEKSTIWIFQLRRSCVMLAISPFCDDSNISTSTQTQLRTILTTWLRSYALNNTEEIGRRGYAVLSKNSEDNGSAMIGGLVVGALFTWVSSVALLFDTVWFLVNWDDNFLPSLAIMSLVITLALLAVFVTLLDVVLAVLGQHGPYLALSAFPVYNPLTFLVLTFCTLILGFVLNKSECSKKLVIITSLTGILSATVPSFCFHAFWLGVAALLYPVRVGSVLLVIVVLAFVMTFAVFVFFLLVCSCKNAHETKQIDFRFSHAVLTAFLGCTISFLAALLSVYVTPVSVINSSAGDPLTSLVTFVLPITIGLLTVWVLWRLVVVSEKESTIPIQQSSSLESPPPRMLKEK